MKTIFSGNTQRKLGAVLAGGALLFMSSFAMAAITGSRHDLSTTGLFNQFTPTAGNSEICVFCHTPHGADTAAPAPLWNRTLHTLTYTTYAALGTSSLDGATAPVGSVSLACLSCHDGTQAMNEVINAPGSGAGTGTWAGTWNAAGSADTATPVGSLNYATASIVNIGTDLRNDHPVGIQYGGGRAGGYASGTSYAAGTTTDADFKAITAVTGKALWYVDTNGTAGRQNVDLPLYTRADTVDYLGVAIPGGANQPYVECASCHDPHNTTNGTFLRYSNANSTLCLACHDK